MSDAVSFQIQFLFEEVKGQRSNMLHACHVIIIKTTQFMFRKHLFFFFSPVQCTCIEKACIFSYLIVKIYLQRVRTKGYSTDLLDPTQVESKKCSQIQWPVPSINAEPVDIFLGEE